ncbi:MAG TPA: hypothetical protein VGQ46_17070 [Thermoanaerobaculia bacterium]|jgi:hypothetical protein|nr:hypothetical protein [Thermoanaerobaculia bacterium]
MRQKVGDITNSQRVQIHQDSTTEGSQEIGAVSGSSDVRISQVAGRLADASASLRDIVSLTTQLEPTDTNDASQALQVYLTELAHGAVLSSTDLQLTARSLSADSHPSELVNAVRDISAAVSLVSGSIAISQIGNPMTLALAVPAVLAAAGILEADRLTTVYERIKRLLRNFMK